MAAAAQNSPIRYQIGDLVLDTGSRSVARGEEKLKLGALTFDLLLALVEAAPAMVSYDELVDRVWRGRPTTPETIAQRAKILRAALSDDAKSPRYFELIRGQGYRLVADVTAVAEATIEKRGRSRLAWFTAAAVVAVAAVFAFTQLDQPTNVTPSVAVLPLADLSDTGNQQHLADGLAEELLNALAGLDGLAVASRTESFAFRGPSDDLRSIGRQLNVSNVLEGSIRTLGDDVRVTVQLIEVDTGYHLWSRTYTDEQQSAFELQESVAASAAGAVGVLLDVGGVNDFYGAGTRNIEAYEAFLRRDYESAIQLDPTYANAWVGQGFETAGLVWREGPDFAPEILERARQHVDKAIELEPQLARAHIAAASIAAAAMDWSGAEQSFTKAFALNRDAEGVYRYANFLTMVGRNRDALLAYEESDALAGQSYSPPLSAQLLRSQADIALFRFEEAKALAAKMPEIFQSHTLLVIAMNEGSHDNMLAAIDSMSPVNPPHRHMFSPMIELFDSPDEALDFLVGLLEDNNTGWPAKVANIATMAAYLGYPEYALDVFSWELRHTSIRYGILWYPMMRDVRALPEFKELMIDVGLVDYWSNGTGPDACGPACR